MSRRGVKELIEKGFKMDICKKDGEIEDKYIGQCLEVHIFGLWINYEVSFSL